jgi:bifunctional non-homologous end joining protein LigD
MMDRVEVSNPGKVLFPKSGLTPAGLTKGDVVAHYRLVGPAMMPWLERRPVSIQRFPRGIGAKGFMQKNAADHFPATIERYEVPRQEGGVTTYPVLTTTEDITYLANQNTITFHTWTATVERPDQPDWFLLDLDPEEGDLAAVRRATELAGEVLRRFGLRPMVLATGSKGFHVRARIEAGPSFEEVGLAGRAAAGLVAAAEPKLATVEFLKRDRHGRVFVDWLRNGPIATSVVPWSLRPRPGAPVAVPVTWDELENSRPDGWTLGHLGDRLALALQPPPPAPLPVADIVAAARAAGVDLDTSVDRFGRKR